MKVRKVRFGVMNQLQEAPDQQRRFSEYPVGTNLCVVASSSPVEWRRVSLDGIHVQVEGGLREAKRESGDVMVTEHWLIKDPPGLRGYFCIGPIAKKRTSLSDGILQEMYTARQL